MTLDLVFARTPLAQALRDGPVSLSGCIALADELGIGGGERIGFVVLVLQRIEFALQFGKFGCRGPRPVEPVRLVAQRVRAYR